MLKLLNHFFLKIVKNNNHRKTKKKAESNRCKGCRFDRCLRAGMDWRNLISPMEKEHIARLEMRQILVTAKSTMDSNEVNTVQICY